MSYWTISQMSLDNDLTSREAAAAAQEQHDTDPTTWALKYGLRLAASPGWAAAWESAIASDVERPGKDEGVITDSMILSAVQALIASGV
jgi:hypothetical protein